MDSDDIDDDFFDKLVNSDSDDDDGDRRRLAPAPVAEASAGDLAALTLSDQSDDPAPAPADHHPEAQPAAPGPQAPEPTPDSHDPPATQPQWNGTAGADPFGGPVPEDHSSVQASLPFHQCQRTRSQLLHSSNR